MAAPASNDRPYNDEITHSSTEQTPLIPKRHNGDSSHSQASGFHARVSTLIGKVVKVQSPNSIITILCIIIFIGCTSSGFQNMSTTRIFEDILCRQYYDKIRSREGPPINEDMCKIDAVQSELAYLFAIMNSLNAGFSVLSALPWGIAADTIGRRPIFALGLTGMALAILWMMVVGWFHQTLPLRLVWLSPVAYLLGGGNPVLSATVASMATDVVPESERSVSFMRIHGASIVGNLISPALASVMMSSTGPWPPLFLAFLLTWLPAFAIFLVPESLKVKPQDDGSESGDISYKARLRRNLEEFKNSAAVFNSRPMVIILFICMLQLAVWQCTFQFLGQFTSKRYHIPLADTGYISSAYGATFVTVSFVILPWVSSFVLSPRAPSWLRFSDEKRRDLFFARSACVASMLGTFILGLSPSIPVFVGGLSVLAFGVAAESFVKGIATLFVSPERRSRLFTILGLAQIASDLWVSPALAALFSLGMRLGGVWIGLPYFGVSSLCVVMLTFALCLNLPQALTTDEESESNGGSDSENEDISR